MSNIITTDNCKDKSIEENDRENLISIANCNISVLRTKNKSSVLSFPIDVSKNENKIEDNVCLIVDDKLHTNNIMGFIGVNDTQLTIRSRFADKEKEDYFMHYMLQRVFSINIVDLKHNSSNEDIFDFRLYIFPYYLKKALRQGLFKQYQTQQYNDANIRGVVEVNRHIKLNVPFAGKVAYRTREYSYDNNVNQLIRHTIEYIKTQKLGKNVLQCDALTKEAVEIITAATPSYNRNNRLTILNNNREQIIHPYYSDYTILQKLCRQILSHERLKYGQTKDKIYGLLFDGAWLWEEYLNTILAKCEFQHPNNITKKGEIYLFEPNNRQCYPDFIKDKIVLDAKYKHLKSIYPDDMYQIISYMHVEKAEIGGFIYPHSISNNDTPKCKEEELGTLRGHGGKVFKYGVGICNNADDYGQFCEKMQEAEEEIKESF